MICYIKGTRLFLDIVRHPFIVLFLFFHLLYVKSSVLVLVSKKGRGVVEVKQTILT